MKKNQISKLGIFFVLLILFSFTASAFVYEIKENEEKTFMLGDKKIEITKLKFNCWSSYSSASTSDSSDLCWTSTLDGVTFRNNEKKRMYDFLTVEADFKGKARITDSGKEIEEWVVKYYIDFDEDVFITSKLPTPISSKINEMKELNFRITNKAGIKFEGGIDYTTKTGFLSTAENKIIYFDIEPFIEDYKKEIGPIKKLKDISVNVQPFVIIEDITNPHLKLRVGNSINYNLYGTPQINEETGEIIEIQEEETEKVSKGLIISIIILIAVLAYFIYFVSKKKKKRRKKRR